MYKFVNIIKSKHVAMPINLLTLICAINSFQNKQICNNEQINHAVITTNALSHRPHSIKQTNYANNTNCTQSKHAAMTINTLPLICEMLIEIPNEITSTSSATPRHWNTLPSTRDCIAHNVERIRDSALAEHNCTSTTNRTPPRDVRHKMTSLNNHGIQTKQTIRYVLRRSTQAARAVPRCCIIISHRNVTFAN